MTLSKLPYEENKLVGAGLVPARVITKIARVIAKQDGQG
jgi:hypothetical protein